MYLKLFSSTAAVYLLLCVCLLIAAQGNVQAQTRQASDVLLILPFENTSALPEYNWIGESFADSMGELFTQPGLLVISTDEREMVFQRLRLPLTTLPSRATALKLAREANATMIVMGTYGVTAGQGDLPSSLQGTARVIKVNEGRLMGETLPDGRWITREYAFGGAVTTLQEIQGRLTYQILYQRDKALPLSQQQLVDHAVKVPQKAFEAFVKCAQTKDTDKVKANFCKNALRIYADANSGAVYPQAAYELGYYFMKQQDWKSAAEYFSRLQKKDAHYVKAAFYAGIGYFRLGDVRSAQAAFTALANDVPLTRIYNNAGAIDILAARDAKSPEDKARLLDQSLQYLTNAARSAGSDPFVTFNYAYALFAAGKYADAAVQLKAVVTTDPHDGQTLFLYAKTLERLGRTQEAVDADNEARRYLSVYAKWQTEWQKSQTTGDVPVRLHADISSEEIVKFSRPAQVDVSAVDNGRAQEVMVKARELYTAGADDDALSELRRVITLDPTNGDAYLLIGQINLRRSDQESAISALKTALFWNAKLIDAHILLGRIYCERSDRAQAISHASSAMQLDQTNQEVIALQRMVTMGCAR